MGDEIPDCLAQPSPEDIEIEKLPEDLRDRLEPYRWYTGDQQVLADLKWLCEEIVALRTRIEEFNEATDELEPILAAIYEHMWLDKWPDKIKFVGKLRIARAGLKKDISDE